jgi:hypothetical protein
MKQQTPMVNPNYFSKCPLMHNQFFQSNENVYLITIIEWRLLHH